MGGQDARERDHTAVSASSGAAAYRFYGDELGEKKGGIGGGAHPGVNGELEEVRGRRNGGDNLRRSEEEDDGGTVMHSS